MDVGVVMTIVNKNYFFNQIENLSDGTAAKVIACIPGINNVVLLAKSILLNRMIKNDSISNEQKIETIQNMEKFNSTLRKCGLITFIALTIIASSVAIFTIPALIAIPVVAIPIIAGQFQFLYSSKQTLRKKITFIEGEFEKINFKFSQFLTKIETSGNGDNAKITLVHCTSQEACNKGFLKDELPIKAKEIFQGMIEENENYLKATLKNLLESRPTEWKENLKDLLGLFNYLKYTDIEIRV
jgi:hypothetical protein